MDTQLDSIVAHLRAATTHTHTRYGKQASRIAVGFRCKNCQAYVHTITMLAGVKNRNHCPYCLWSRHLDLVQAGDRLSACKASMEPIGLTVKRSRDKYGYARYGELMLIHRCGECGSISLNRIAADDAVDVMLGILQASSNLDLPTLQLFKRMDIHLLSRNDASMVTKQLFGREGH